MPAKVKEMAEATEKASPEQAIEKQPERPEKAAGPMSLLRAASAPQPPPTAKPSDADTLNDVELNPGAPGRARSMTALQKSVGNTRLSRMLGSTVQARLAISSPDDIYEKEADQVAETIASGQKTPQKAARISRLPVTGLAAPTNRNEPITRKESNGVLQTASNGAAHGEAVDANMQARIESPGGGRALPEGMRREMESGLGADFSDVRVHDNAQDQADAGSLNAKAFTHENHIWLGQGASADDRKLMAHELTHVVQQTGGVQRKPTRDSESSLDRPKPAMNHLPQPQESMSAIARQGELSYKARPDVTAPKTPVISTQKLVASPKPAPINDEEARPLTGPEPSTPVKFQEEVNVGKAAPGVSKTAETVAKTNPVPRNTEARTGVGLLATQAAIATEAAAALTGAATPETRDEATSSVTTAPNAPGGSGHPLPPSTRARMETAFDHDFGHVRIHSDDSAATAASSQKAHAFTVGSDISFGSGEFAPHTSSGDQLLAHELTHVVQHDEGRMPSGGVLSPKHELEQEAYATEHRISPTLPSIDEKLGTQRAPSGTSSRYHGEPALARATDEQPADAPERRGPNTTEEALMGPLPSAADARAEVAAPSVPNPEAVSPAPTAPSMVLPAPTPEEQGPFAANVASPQPETGDAGNRILLPPQAAAAETPASPAALAQEPAPALRDPAAWIDALTREGALRLEALQTSASTSVQRIRARAEGSIAEARSAFQAAGARFEEAAQAARAAIETFQIEGAQRISTEVAALAVDLDTHFATRSEEARGSADDTRALIAQTVETEANRSVSESEVRAERARGLSENTGTAEDAPLVEGQREIASCVASEVAEQCLQTGQDAAAEVRKAGESRSTGIDTNLEQVLQTLETARVAAHTKLMQSEAETLAAFDDQAARTSEEVEARRAEGMLALDQQEAALGSWIHEQSEQECAALSTRAEQSRADLATNIQSLTESFADAATQAEPFFAGVSAEEPGITLAQQAFSEEMARVWTAHVAPQLSDADGLVTSFEEHASGVEEGILRVLTDAHATLEQTTNETTDGLATLGERFGSFVEEAGERTLSAVRDGVAGTRAEADRAVAEHASAVMAEAEQTVQAIRSAVDEQLAWEDQQIDRAAEQIAVGQTQAAQQYRSLEAQARAMDAGGATAAIARGWLGDLWDWFSDLAESTLEWFQEKLGRVWGNIIGQILRVIIYVVGVIVCAVAWVGAQIINLVWGFIWGETAIPGYGGGIFNFIGDLIAGILIYGDLRDLFKYGLWRPFITGEGPWWLNLTMFVLTLVFLIPIAGDLLKVIVKGMKGGGRAVLRLLAMVLGEELAERILRRLGIEVAEEFAERLARELGEELAQRMIRDLGAEAAEELFERLGKETIQHLAQELSPTVIKNLADELGERTLKRLAETLSGNVIQTLSTDLGRETIEKLLRTVTPEVVAELHQHLGKDALQNLLRGLRGVTIKEYLDALGEVALRNLGQDLEGYAVKTLFDDLGAPALRELAERLAPTTIRDLVNELGKDLVLRFKDSFGVDGLRQITDAISPAEFKAFVREIGEDFIEQFGARALAEVGPHLRPTELLDFLTSPRTSMPFLRSLAEMAGAGAVLRAASAHFGNMAELGRVVASAELFGVPAAGLKQFIERCPANGWRKLAEIDQFFWYAATSGSSWGDLIRWAETLGRNTLREAATVGGRTVADPLAPHFKDLVDAAGNAVRITFNSRDALHVASRHTWERFAVTPGNAGAANSMLPEAIRAADIENIGARLLQDPAVATLVGRLAPGASSVETVIDGAITYEVRVNLQNGVNGMVTFYPVAGAGVETLSRDAMRAIIWLFNSI